MIEIVTLSSEARTASAEGMVRAGCDERVRAQIVSGMAMTMVIPSPRPNARAPPTTPRSSRPPQFGASGTSATLIERARTSSGSRDFYIYDAEALPGPDHEHMISDYVTNARLGTAA